MRLRGCASNVLGGLATRHVGMGMMTNSARRKRRVSYLRESALGENTGSKVSTR